MACALATCGHGGPRPAYRRPPPPARAAAWRGAAGRGRECRRRHDGCAAHTHVHTCTHMYTHMHMHTHAHTHTPVERAFSCRPPRPPPSFHSSPTFTLSLFRSRSLIFSLSLPVSLLPSSRSLPLSLFSLSLFSLSLYSLFSISLSLSLSLAARRFRRPPCSSRPKPPARPSPPPQGGELRPSLVTSLSRHVPLSSRPSLVTSLPRRAGRPHQTAAAEGDIDSLPTEVRREGGERERDKRERER